MTGCCDDWPRPPADAADRRARPPAPPGVPQHRAAGQPARRHSGGSYAPQLFTRIFARAGGGPVDIDAQLLTGTIRPGDTVPGHVVLRGGLLGTDVQGFSFAVIASWSAAPGTRAGDDEINRAYADGPFPVPRGEEVVVPFTIRLPWATPFTEVAGRALGVVLELRTRVDDSALRTGSDHDLLHVSPLPLHEALLDAFAGHGYTCEAGRLVNEWIPDVDQPFVFYQSLELRDRTTDRIGTDLELVLLTNAVGCEILLRRAGHGVLPWREKPPARRFLAAHHDLERTDWSRLVRDWLRQVAAA
ncbi:sporulation protein [Streptomyces sp. JW3]|uniref:sporulation protein n=1 Tax=Streptomyces sp. JW3 TaxID=3456955 RepID=UPI003FA4C89F